MTRKNQEPDLAPSVGGPIEQQTLDALRHSDPGRTWIASSAILGRRRRRRRCAITPPSVLVLGSIDDLLSSFSRMQAAKARLKLLLAHTSARYATEGLLRVEKSGDSLFAS